MARANRPEEASERDSCVNTRDCSALREFLLALFDAAVAAAILLMLNISQKEPFDKMAREETMKDRGREPQKNTTADDNLDRFGDRPSRDDGPHAVWVGSIGTWYRFDLTARVAAAQVRPPSWLT